MTSLKLSSIRHEYYHGDLPGMLQYKKSVKELSELEISIEKLMEEMDQIGGTWYHLPCTAYYRDVMLPHTRTPKDWRLIMLMQKTQGDNIWLKGALMNIHTNEIALMTSCNNESAIVGDNNRPIRSNCSGWYVGHYRMGAPLKFWSDLAEICKQYL